MKKDIILEKCKYSTSCPVYSGELKAHNLTTAMFKRNYCETDDGNWKACKRFLVEEEGLVPGDIMPHDHREIEDIISSIQG